MVALVDRNAGRVVAEEGEHFANFDAHPEWRTARGEDVKSAVFRAIVVEGLPAGLARNLAAGGEHTVVNSLRFEPTTGIAPVKFVVGVPRQGGGV